MYFFKDTNGNWIIGESVDSIVSKVPCELRKSSPTTVAVRTVESRILLLAPIEVTALRKNAAGEFYATYAEFKAAVSPFFDNAPITSGEVDAKIWAEVDILSDRIDTVEGIANAASSGSLGSIKPTDAAPTPARNGNYTFSIGGDKPAWLTAEAGVTTVKAGDGVAVVYTAPSSYTYTHVDTSKNGELLSKNDSGFKKYLPSLPYGTTVVIDSGAIKDDYKANNLYLENLKFADNTLFLWDGFSGIKIESGKVSKIYDLSPNSNDAVGATNQLYCGGIVAENESYKLKKNNFTSLQSLKFNDVIRKSNEPWTISFVVKRMSKSTNTETILGYDTSTNDVLYFTGSHIGFRNDAGAFGEFLNVFDSDFVGKNIAFSFSANGDDTLDLYISGKFISTISIATLFYFNSLFNRYNFVDNALNGELSFIEILDTNLSSNEIKTKHNELIARFPEIESVKIGKQTWASSNWDAEYAGDILIPEVQDNAEWAALTTPGWCYYENDTDKGAIYGKLYNHEAIALIMANLPKGWRVPKEADWEQLMTYLGGTALAGGQLKKEGLVYFNTPNTGATNHSSFSAIGSGFRSVDGKFYDEGKCAQFASSNKFRYYLADNTSASFYSNQSYHGFGLSLRLIKDDFINEIVTYGDSITMGVGSIPYSDQLQLLVGSDYDVKNMGVGGESATDIAGRQGGYPILVAADFVIPTGTEPVSLTLKSLDDTAINILIQADRGINPVTIQGIEGHLTRVDNVYYFTRTSGGILKAINAGSTVATISSKIYRDAIHIIHIGQNGGWNDTPSKLIEIINAMIKNLSHNNYIVISTHGNTTAELEALMLRTYGANYLNSREYLSRYAMAELGLTPDSADDAAMDLGLVPPSLLYDGLHLNTNGNKALANRNYAKLTELGMIKS